MNFTQNEYFFWDSWNVSWDKLCCVVNVIRFKEFGLGGSGLHVRCGRSDLIRSCDSSSKAMST